MRYKLDQSEVGGSGRRKSRKHGEPWFSGTLVIGDPQENREKSEEQFDFFMFFSVFQAEDFGKLSAPVFRIFLDWSRALGTKIQQISYHFSYFQLFDPNKYENPSCSLYF